MTSVHSFVFDGSTRIGNDPCGITEKDLQNQKNGSYITQNYFEKDCGMKKPIGFATTQPQLAASAVGMAQGLGQSDLAFRQAIEDAEARAILMAAFEPIDRLARFGQGLTGVGGMLGTVQTQTGPAAPVQSPLAGALQAGIGAFSLGKLFS